VLPSMPQGVDGAIAEMHRLLEPGGLAIVTVPTDRFMDTLWLPSLMRRVSERWYRQYTRKLNERLPHFNTYPADDWCALFQAQGFEILTRMGYFTPGLGRAWSVLVLQGFRAFGVLKLIGVVPLRSVVACLLKRYLRPVIRQEEERIARQGDKPHPFGYLLIVARRPGPAVDPRPEAMTADAMAPT